MIDGIKRVILSGLDLNVEVQTLGLLRTSAKGSHASRLLGRRAVSADRALLLLRNPNAGARTHGLLELYLLGAGSGFTHAPNDASVRKALTVNDAERLHPWSVSGWDVEGHSR